MAWQTPKTDWGPADAVRDVDFNRIEGNILELRKSQPIDSSIYLYVATTGSDTTGDGTEAKPYATIQKAIDTLPWSLNSYNVNIFIAGGTYNGGVDISDIVHGTVSFANQSSQDVVINGGFQVSGCSAVQIVGFNKLTVNGRMWLLDTQMFHCSANTVEIVDDIFGEALSVNNSNATFGGTVSTKTLSYGSGIIVGTGTQLFVETAVIQTGTGTGIKADYGGLVAYGQATNNAVTKLATMRGGRIYSGAQANIPSY